jgi:hypothetical protein
MRTTHSRITRIEKIKVKEKNQELLRTKIIYIDNL